jgi:hypothetical protein
MSKKHKGRIDMILEEATQISETKDSIIYRFRMVPNPKLWERKDEPNMVGYLNKTDSIFISDEEFAKAVKTMKGIPVTITSVQVEPTEYIERRKKRLKVKDK